MCITFQPFFIFFELCGKISTVDRIIGSNFPWFQKKAMNRFEPNVGLRFSLSFQTFCFDFFINVPHTNLRLIKYHKSSFFAAFFFCFQFIYWFECCTRSLNSNSELSTDRKLQLPAVVSAKFMCIRWIDSNWIGEYWFTGALWTCLVKLIPNNSFLTFAKIHSF